jgi:hypothetical protein
VLNAPVFAFHCVASDSAKHVKTGLTFGAYNTNITRDGLGGAKTLRGILRNRVTGDDIFYGNAELRWKFFRTIISD